MIRSYKKWHLRQLIEKTSSVKNIFEYYFSNVPCTYSMTTKLDITKIIKSKKNYILRCFIILQLL